MQQNKKIVVQTIKSQFETMLKKANQEKLDIEKALADKDQQIELLERNIAEISE